VLTAGTRCLCTDLFPLFPAWEKPCLNQDGSFQKQGEAAPNPPLPAKKKPPYLIHLYSFPKQSQAVASLGGGAEKQHLREELMAPCSPELQTGSGRAWMSCRGPAPTPARSLSAPRRVAEGGRVAAESQGDARGPAPRVPLLLVASHLQVGARICGFSVVTPLLKPAEPGFGLSLEENGPSLGAGLTLVACSWAASCGLGEIKAEENHFFFPPKPSQVPAQRARGAVCSQLFPSKASPYLRRAELGSGRASRSRNAPR